jgi:MOSC domain-containing protein YiiM
VRNAPLPAGDLPASTRSAVACLASILELETADVPAPPARHPQPWTVWRNWLAGRGLGLVPIRDPATFSWPGPWIAVLHSGACVVAFGSPPGIAWNPLGSDERFDEVVTGYLIAPADVALWAAEPPTTTRTAGTVEAIAVAADAEATVVLVDQALAVAGRGLEGDRYFDGRGTFSNEHARGHDLTLIEAEVLDALHLTVGAARRNVVTRGIDLNALVGERFRIGAVACVGQRLCEPCAHLERLAAPGILLSLVHRGGLRADVLGEGTIRVGDPVVYGNAP